MREIDCEVLATALLGSGEAIRERFLGNMSKRAAGMLLEDMEYFGPVFESEIKEAKQYILDAHDYVLHEAENQREFRSIFDKYEKETKKQKGIDSQDKYQGQECIALVFRGKKETAETVSAVGFDSMETQANFCEFINRQKLSDGSFVFARETEQMVEYEITKPLLACFDQIAGWDGIIVGTALRKARPDIIASALRGLDKESRRRIIENLPHRAADDVMCLINMDEKSDIPLPCPNTREARKKIVNTIIAVEKQFKKGKFPKNLEIVKD
jgi:hypothetical protein